MHTFTVVGFYPSSRQRFAHHISATSAEMAELAAQQEFGIVVVGTFAGALSPADREQFVRWPE